MQYAATARREKLKENLAVAGGEVLISVQAAQRSFARVHRTPFYLVTQRSGRARVGRADGQCEVVLDELYFLNFYPRPRNAEGANARG